MTWKPLFLTFQLIAVAVVLAGSLGILGAWAVTTVENAGRTGRRIALFFFTAMVAAIAMPMILHAAAWEATAGKFGWLLLTQTGARSYQGLGGLFSGLIACGWIHGLAGTSLVALSTWYGLRRIPRQLIEQSQLEMGWWSTWWNVRLPIALPWVLAGLLGTAALAATEMTVVDLYGFRTVADVFYLYYAVDPTATAITMTCVTPLLIGSALVGLHTVARRRVINVRDDPGTAAGESSTPAVKVIAGAVALLVALLVLTVPVAGLLIKAGHDVVVTDSGRVVSWSFSRFAEVVGGAPRTFAAEYKWTLLLGALTASVAIAIAWPLAAIGRTHRPLESLLDLLSVILFLIPGPIVGLAVVAFFQLPVSGFQGLYQSTLVPTIIALLFRAGVVTYWVLRTAYRWVDEPLLMAARLEVSWMERLWVVDRPIIWRGLLIAWLAAAIIASGDVPVTLPVVPPGVSTVGTRLFGLLHSGARYQEAALALWYVAAVAVIAVALAQLIRPKGEAD